MVEQYYFSHYFRVIIIFVVAAGKSLVRSIDTIPNCYALRRRRTRDTVKPTVQITKLSTSTYNYSHAFLDFYYGFAVMANFTYSYHCCNKVMS